MAVGDVKYFGRATAANADKYRGAGWEEYGQEQILSMPGDPVFLFEFEGEPPLADEIKPIENTAGIKNDHGKDRFDLIDPRHERAIARVLTFGAKEYGDHNFKKVKDPYDRYYAALRRHLNDYRCGQKTDPKTGESHLAHVIANALFLMWFDDQAKE